MRVLLQTTTALFVMALLGGCVRHPVDAKGPASPPGASPVLPSPGLQAAGGASIADITARALPSVVNIASSTQARNVGVDSSPNPGRSERGLGSGVIVAPGIVLTNNHVIAGATEIGVTTYDRREFSARVVGTDPKSDLAVLRLEGDSSGLRPISMGDSSRLRLGDVVLAIGNPFGVGQTVTMGIVSAKGRADVGIVDYEDFIQTDAAINPGNSGGALIDMEGNLVGINTAILSRSGGYMGIGFAIPTNMAKPIMESLLTQGRVIRGWLGVGMQDLDPELVKAMNLGTLNGALVSDVDLRGPAYRAGLRRGDVIVRVDGRAIESTGVLRNVIGAAGAKRGVKIEVLRDGKPLTLTADLEEVPGEREAAQAAAASRPPAPPGGVGGVTLDGLTTAMRQRFNIPAEVQYGVVLTQVEPNSSAARAGLRAGDVILEVNRQRVEGLTGLRELLTKASGKVLMLVWRQGGSFYVMVTR